MAHPGPSRSAGPAPGSIELKTNGHCFICLKPPDDPGMVKVISNPTGDNIQCFTSLLRYLTGSPPDPNAAASSDDVFQGVLKLIANKVPPLCVACNDNLLALHGMHQNLLEIQRRIQGQTQVIRERVAETKVRGQGYSSRDNFVASLGPTIDSDANLVLWVHQEIIDRGDDPVTFPGSSQIIPEDEEDGGEDKVEGMEEIPDDRTGAGDEGPGTVPINVVKAVASVPSRFDGVDSNSITDEDLLDKDTWMEMVHTPSLKPNINWLRNRRKRLKAALIYQADPANYIGKRKRQPFRGGGRGGGGGDGGKGGMGRGGGFMMMR